MTGSDDSFAEAVLDLVGQIPPGRVMSYGGVAAALGSRAARQVGKVMAYSGGSVPWWRVVRASGEPAQGLADEARPHYLAEGTPLREASDGSYRVAIRVAAWAPWRD